MFALTISKEKQELIIKVASAMSEKQKRQFLASEAALLGYGGVSLISRITGVSRTTIMHGIHELDNGDVFDQHGRQRAFGGGRKSHTDQNSRLSNAIEEIVSGSTYGSPMTVLKWPTLSLRKISMILKEKYLLEASYNTDKKILIKPGYSRQANKKMEQVGNPAPDRDEQFRYINTKAEEFINAGQPVISIDTKKKENIGNFRNQGTEYRKAKDPRHVPDHDFPIPELGNVSPYDIYVLNENTGFVNLGTDHDTAEFSVESILRWWNMIGKNTYPDATRIFITCDSCRSNSVNGRLWKQQLAEFSGGMGLEVHVSHFPVGASK